jgi:pimeloyl-ACP methyl ester carboxylesterase
LHLLLARVKNARRWLVPLLGLLVIALMLYRFEHSQVYHPTRDAEYTPDDVGRVSEEVWLKTPDNLRLHAWFFAAEQSAPRARYVMLFCHGNGGNLTSRPGYYRAILETGVSLLAFDYRGYGRSGGEPSEAGTYTDTATSRRSTFWFGANLSAAASPANSPPPSASAGWCCKAPSPASRTSARSSSPGCR